MRPGPGPGHRPGRGRGVSALGPDGAEWITTAEALERIPGLNASTLRSWIHRGRVRRRRVGRASWVCWDDVVEAEAAAFLAARRRARHASTGQAFGVGATLVPAVHVCPPDPMRMRGGAPCPAPAPAGTVRTGAESWTCRTCAGCAVVLVRTPSTTSCPTHSAAAMMRTIFVRLIVRATPRAASGGGIGSARSGRPAPGSGLERLFEILALGWGRTPGGPPGAGPAMLPIPLRPSDSHPPDLFPPNPIFRRNINVLPSQGQWWALRGVPVAP